MALVQEFGGITTGKIRFKSRFLGAAIISFSQFAFKKQFYYLVICVIWGKKFYSCCVDIIR